MRGRARLWNQLETQMRRDHGLTIARYDVLATLDAAGELGSSVVLSPSGLSKLLGRMQTSQLIRREPDPQDARATFAAITPRGRALLGRARRTHHDLLQQRFGDALDDGDVADLARIMGRIAASLRADGTAG